SNIASWCRARLGSGNVLARVVSLRAVRKRGYVSRHTTPAARSCATRPSGRPILVGALHGAGKIRLLDGAAWISISDTGGPTSRKGFPKPDNEIRAARYLATGRCVHRILG